MLREALVWDTNGDGSGTGAGGAVVYANLGYTTGTINNGSFSPSFILQRYQTLNRISPSLSGGNPATWEISPALPAGLVFTNGTITGTPTVNMTLTTYTVWANNTGGSATATFNLTVFEPQSNFSYSSSVIVLTRDSAMTPLLPNITGGNAATWEISPALPSGTTFNNGVISGTPTVNMTQTTYTIWANNTGGTATSTLTITINEPAITFTYPSASLTVTRGVDTVDLIPALGGGNVATMAISPALPSGLTLFSNGTIYGIPTVNMTQTMFEIWANNTGGSTVTYFNITILEPQTTFTYNSTNIVLTRDSAMTTLSPNLSGGNAATWEISPALPSGLIFNNGVISGTPTVNMTQISYTIWANNTGGSASVVITITVNEPQTIVSYSSTNIILTRDIAMASLHPSVSNGVVETWEISPALPSGLTFNNGVISGTPTVNMTQTIYTIWANNTGGSTPTNITISVLEPQVVFTYSLSNLILTRDSAMSTLSPTLSGGNAATWEISPALPSGLTFNNGVIYGTPTVNMTQTTYTIWANNTGGSSLTTLTITVNEPRVTFIYSPSNFVLARAQSLPSTLTPITSGGFAETWSIYPSLPSGLSFENGSISGTPNVNLSQTTFTVWANNSGGSSSTLLIMTILEPVSSISYNNSYVALTRDLTISDIVPTNVGGNAATWEIYPVLPSGLTFNNGVISGTPLVNIV